MKKLVPRQGLGRHFKIDWERVRVLRHSLGALGGTASVFASLACLGLLFVQPTVWAAAGATTFFLLGFACKAMIERHFKFWKW